MAGNDSPLVGAIAEDGRHPTVNVSSIESLAVLLRNLNGLPQKPPSIYIDGTGMGSENLTTLHLLLKPSNTLYVLSNSILSLLEQNPAADDGCKSLKQILESKSIWKVGFDLRDLSRVLFHQHKISLDGVYDLQLMELASRNPAESRKYLAGFAKCVDQDIAPSNANKKRWLQPRETTNMHLFNSLGHVPWDAMRRIELFGDLWTVYRHKLRPPGQAFWLRSARCHSIERVKDSRKGERRQSSASLGPNSWWDRELRDAEMEDWLEEILMEERQGHWKLDEDAEWVPTGWEDWD